MEVEGQAQSKVLSLVLDAANVCWEFVRSQPGWTEARSGPQIRPPLTGVSVAIEFWRQYGVHPVCICPRWWFRIKEQGLWGNADFEAQDFATMEHLRHTGLLYCSPSGEHDDLYLLDYAFRTDGFLVSNDKYRDHQASRDLGQEWIEERRIGFMFVRNTFIPNPDGIKRLEEFCAAHHVQVAHQPPPSMLPPPPASTFSPSQVSHSSTCPVPSLPSTVTSSCASQVHSRADELVREMIHVPATAVGHIIGKGGAKIQQLCTDSGARIHVGKSGVDASDPNRQVVLVGKASEVQIAKTLIQQLVDYSNEKQKQNEYQPPIRIAKTDPVGLPPGTKVNSYRRLSSEMMSDDDLL